MKMGLRLGTEDRGGGERWPSAGCIWKGEANE